MRIPSADISVVRGATLPDVAWQMKSGGQPFDGTGSTWVLTIRSGDQTIRKSTADADGLTYDNFLGRLVWRRTLAESRLIRAGKVGRYEIERHIGGQEELTIVGAVEGLGWSFDD